MATKPTIDGGVPALINRCGQSCSILICPTTACIDEGYKPLQIWIPILNNIIWLIELSAALLLYTTGLVIGAYVMQKWIPLFILQGNIFQSERECRLLVCPGHYQTEENYLPVQHEWWDLEHVVAYEQAHSPQDHWWKPLGFLC